MYYNTFRLVCNLVTFCLLLYTHTHIHTIPLLLIYFIAPIKQERDNSIIFVWLLEVHSFLFFCYFYCLTFGFAGQRFNSFSVSLSLSLGCMDTITTRLVVWTITNRTKPPLTDLVWANWLSIGTYIGRMCWESHASCTKFPIDLSCRHLFFV